MVASGGHMARNFPLDPRFTLAGFGRQPAGRPGGYPQSPDELAVRSLQGAGCAALLGLPLLLLASLMFETPVAGPALIASGYLGIAFALQSERPGRAAVMSGIVVLGLVAWLLLCLASGAIPVAGPGLMAALLTPLFASAPTLARLVIRSRAMRAAPPAGIAAREVDAAPSQEILREPDGIPHAESRARTAVAVAVPSCDVGEAVRFALRHIRRQAEAKRISLMVEAEADLGAACDQQTCRRLLCALLDHIVGCASADAGASLSARKVRGVVLLRVRAEGCHVAGAAKGLSLAVARAMVEAAGGTLVEDRAREGWSLSARLDLAAIEVAMNPPTGSKGAD